MGKSRFSKTKAAGLLCGMSKCKDYKFEMAWKKGNASIQNRQMRRMRDKK